MAVVQSFPLLKLPYVPLNEVISHMCPIAQFWFLMISKKTTELVKEKHNLVLEVVDENVCFIYQIVCKNQNGSVFLTIMAEDIRRKDIYESNMISRKLCGMNVPIKFGNGSIITFWEDAFEGFKKMTSLVCKLFKLQSVPDSMIQELRYQKDMTEPNEESYFEELCADWLALENINLIMKCNNIKLWDLKWTSQEMNQFLKKWIESSMMKTVELTAKNMDLKIALEGLSVTSQRKNVRFLGIESELRDCFQIQREDGVSAYIWSYGGNLIMQTY